MKKIIKGLLLLVLCLTLTINGVSAKSYISDLFQAGDKVIINKPIDGTAFIAGNEVKVDETIEGISFVAGNSVKINAIEEYIFAAGNDIVLTNDVNKDLFLAGASVEIKESNLKRDAYIAAEKIDINSTVDRNIYLYGTKVELNGTYNGNILVAANEITINENTVINGTLKYNEDAIIKGLNNSIKTKTYVNLEHKITIKDTIINIISSYIHIIVLAIVLIFISEKIFKKVLEQTKDLTVKDTFITCGKGFLILIGVPIIAMMLLFSGLFISVGVIGAIIYGILVYISKIFTAYILASKLDNKYFKKNMNSYLLVIIGLLVILLLGLIPIIGGLVTFISVIFGLGTIGNLIIELRK